LDRQAKIFLMQILPLKREAKLYIAGHMGMAGSAIWREAERQGFNQLIGKSSLELDLRNREAVFSFFETEKPVYVVLAAAKVGGILANDSYPADFISENLLIQINVMDAALTFGVERLLFLGSSCIYPKFSRQPISEDALMTGPLETTNEAYAIAKIAGIKQVQAIRKQYGKSWISAMPTNLYGPGDNYDEKASHVLPALIRRYENASQQGDQIVINWGTGNPLREFLYVDDLAKAALFLMDNYDGNDHVNVGVGQDISIRDLSSIISEETEFSGETVWDTSKPDGTPRKLLDVSRINKMGWTAETGLREGVRLSLADYRARYGARK
jgi:GDP-L-fucose synthase